MAARREIDDGPEAFRRAVAALRAAIPRSEVVLQETPAPTRLAPHAMAMTADVVVDDEELATGRLVLLHDPSGHEAWQGTFRLVTYVRADLEPEIAADPLLPGVGWAWLTEALAAHGATFLAASGTVTRVISESFGAMSDAARLCPDRDPGVLDAGRRGVGRRTCWPGASCSARPAGCPRCRPA